MSRHQDSHVDTVLHALQDAAPSDTMEQRLLYSLRQAAAAQQHAPQQRWWRLTATATMPRVPVLCASAVALAVLLLAMGTQHHIRQGHAGQPQLAVSTQAWHSLPGARYEASGGAGTRSEVVARFAASRRRGTLTPQSEVHTAIGVSAAMHAADATRVAPQEVPALTPSPLTEQERLLLRFAHRQPPQLLASLSGPATDARAERDKQAVTEFFAPRPTLRGQQEPPEASQPLQQQPSSTRQEP